MSELFDAKIFNGEVFGKYVDRVPNTKLNELLRSRAIVSRPDLVSTMSDQVGGNYVTTPLKGLIGGTPVNYDGVTDIPVDKTKTYQHSRVVVGRAKGWTERDFSYDITGGVDFMENIAQQVSEYWDMVDQETIIQELNGIFSMEDDEGVRFITEHTNDVTGVTNSEGVLGHVDGTTLNNTMQKASGDRKGRFSLAMMHSAVATHLENLKLLVYLKYNDAEGLSRDLNIGTLNGRLVVVDDSMPVLEDEGTATFALTADTEIDASKTYYTREGNSKVGYKYRKVELPEKEALGVYYEKTGDGQPSYVTYVFGDGAIEFTNCGAKVPYEMDRNPEKNGGEDMLYTRQRKCWAPYGISFTKRNMATLSPTNAELADGQNWELVNTMEAGNKLYIARKAIPIARIISLG